MRTDPDLIEKCLDDDGCLVVGGAWEWRMSGADGALIHALTDIVIEALNGRIHPLMTLTRVICVTSSGRHPRAHLRPSARNSLLFGFIDSKSASRRMMDQSQCVNRLSPVRQQQKGAKREEQIDDD